jgi:hypothetical protein
VRSSETRAIALAIAFVAMSMLAFELVLTRIFSVILFNHFAFLAISIGLFGFGVAGVVVFLRPRTFEQCRGKLHIKRCALALPPTMWFVTATLCILPIRVEAGGMLVLYLGLIFLLAALPFFLGGLAITLALMHWPQATNRIYAFDLIGSGLGCLLVIILLAWLDGPTAALAIALLPALAALILDRGRRSWAVVAGVLVGVALNASFGFVHVRFARLRAIDPEFERWNAYSQVTVFEVEPGSWRGWAVAPKSKATPIEMKGIAIDGDAFTPLIRFSGDLEPLALLRDDISAAVYDTHPQPKQVLVIGGGGGKDVLTALTAGAERVTAIELNPIIAEEIIRGEYADYAGGIYDDPRVELIVGEGRTVVRRDPRRYDVVQLSMVDTSASAAAGSYALTENSLYTVGAAQEFLAHVDEGGVFTCTWGNLPNVEGVNRLVSIYAEALRREGLENLEDKFVVINSEHLSSVIVKPSGFSPKEVRRLIATMRERGFRPLYLPGVTVLDRPGDDSPTVIRTLISERELDDFYESHRLDLRPVDDDRPFFFYQDRWRDSGRALANWVSDSPYGGGLFILMKLLVLSAAAVLAFMILPLVIARRRTLGEIRGARAAPAFFLALGIGFITLEVALTQLFGYYLGHPLLGLGVSLTTLLVCTGVGSMLAGRWPSELLRRRLGVTLGLAVLLIAGGAWLVPLVIEATVDGPALLRSSISALTIAPLGVLLGTAFPSGLRMLGGRTALVPWMWALNGGASVFGASLATLLVMHIGFSDTLLAAAGIYGVALVALMAWRPQE